MGAVDKQTYNNLAGRYEVLVKPVKQMMFVAKPDFMELKIATINPNPKDVFYFKVEGKSNKKEAIRPGEIDVSSQPSDCDIYINAIQIVDKTPFKSTMAAGNIRIGLVKDGFIRLDTVFLVKPDETSKLTVVLKKEYAMAQVSSKPAGAQVFIDGKNMGETPWEKSLPVGNYNLKLTLNGHETYNSELSVSKSKLEQLDLRLRKKKKEKEVEVKDVREAKVKKQKSPRAANTKEYYTVAGVIKDETTGRPISSALVRVLGTDGSSEEVSTDRAGKYQIRILPNISYAIIAIKKDVYLNKTDKITTVGLENPQQILKSFNLSPISKVIDISNIKFDLGKWDLKPDFEKSLQKVIQLLKDNPTIIIEIGVRTDSKSSDEYNLALSQKQAQSITDYLIEKGIDLKRLVARGYGETTSNTLSADSGDFPKGSVMSDSFIANLATEGLKEKAHQLNRRVEIKILRNDYVPR